MLSSAMLVMVLAAAAARVVAVVQAPHRMAQSNTRTTGFISQKRLKTRGTSVSTWSGITTL
jgi:hypothetical protein